jgi:hypothetical protein
MEPVSGSLTLRGLRNIKGVTLRALDGHGRPSDGGEALRPTADGWTIALDRKHRTLWYLLEVSC